MSNDPENSDPDEEPPTASIECHEWEVRELAASRLRSMADFIERQNSIITESYVRHALQRIEELLSIHEDLTRPVLGPFNVPGPPFTDDDVPF